MSFGFVQVVALTLGLALLLVAAGRGMPALWRGIALVTLNILVLLLLVDLAAWAVLRQLPPQLYAGGMRVAWYDSQPWYQQYRREFNQVNQRLDYQPYVMWSGSPYAGSQVGVSPDGRRRTPGAVCDSGSYHVALLGGSTMWGVGAPDSGTIAFHLQQRLAELAGRSVCTDNLAERAYVSTQELIRLERELQRGRHFDAVAFYDGINDVINAWRYGEAGTHNGVDRIERKLNQPPFTQWLNTWHAAQLVHAVAARRAPARRPATAPAPDPESLSTSIARTWVENCRMAAALGTRYGFAVACFLQPALAVGHKPLTEAEQASLAAMPPGQRDAFVRSYGHIRSRPPGDVKFVDLSGAFDSLARPLYIDWYHVTPPANAVVARLMAPEIASLPGFPSHRGRSRP